MSIETLCNEGCGQQFTITETPTIQMDGKIEKTIFTCPYCQREYVMFYTDPEIRKLQEKIQKVLQQKVRPNLRYAESVKQEKKIQKQAERVNKLIGEKMRVLREKVESK